MLALIVVSIPNWLLAQSYPYPAPANRNNQIGSRIARAMPFRQSVRPQADGQLMQVPFSGQGFSSPSINQPYSPSTRAPAFITPPVGSGIGNSPAVGSGFVQPQNAQQNFGAQTEVRSFNTGVNPNLAPVFQTPGPAGQAPIPADIDVYVQSIPTQRIAAGGTYSSDSGVIGELIFDERDFSLQNFPRSIDDLFDPRLFRGGGQTLRVEIVPGSDLERYVVNFADPYFLDSNTSLSLSGYYFDRQYFDWDEQRAGGRVAVGQKLTDYLSVNAGLRLEQVTVDNPRLGTSPTLNADLGRHDLNVFNIGLVYDTRQSPFQLDSGSYLSLNFKQAFGDYSFSRGEIDYRVQRMLYKRTPTSGHHTLSFRTQLGFSGSDTPVFENYIAGGFSSMRGFDFRGIGPVENGVRVGGEFQWLSTLEYQFPITQDDMISAVTFIDFGTVEESIELNSENFRVAPGVGLRVNLPFAGMGAPLAFDFAFPVSDATGDEQRTFSFVVGLIR